MSSRFITAPIVPKTWTVGAKKADFDTIVPKTGTIGAVGEVQQFAQGEKRGMHGVLWKILYLSRAKTVQIMDTRKHLAAEKKRCNSHNCAQAVVCTYCDLVNLQEQTALDIAGAYGSGMGNMEGTCGALVGAGMIVGLATKDRNESRARMKQIMTKFQQRNGATQCKLLKGVGTGVILRDCPDCVADASEFLEEIL